MRKPNPLEQSQLGATAGTQATTSLEEQGMGGGQTPATFGADPYAQMRQRSVPAEQQQTYGGQTVRPAPEQMGPPSPGPRRTISREGATFENGRMVSMPTPAPTMAPGGQSGFAERRGLEGAAAAMQAPRTAAERIENQPNLAERILMEEDPAKQARLQRQFDALPADAKAAQIARMSAYAGGTGPQADQQARSNARWAFANQQQFFDRQRAGLPGVPQNQRGGPQGQPQYQPGQIVGSGQYGSVVVGAAGAQMPYVQDPMSPQGEALPVSSGMTRDQYMSNISPGQRQGIRQMLIDAGGKPAEQLKKLEEQRSDLRNLQIVRNRDSSPRSYVGPEEQRLQQQEDDLIWGAMRDPSNLIAGRQRQAIQQQREAEQGQRASQVERERALAEQQKYNAALWKRAESEVDAAITKNGFDNPSENERLQRIYRKFAEAGGQEQALTGGAQVGAGPGAGMAQPPAMGPSQSGAPDFSQQELIVAQPADVDFEMTQDGKYLARLPDNQIMKAIPLNGELLVVPNNRVEQEMLPPGTRYILPGHAARNEVDKIQTKEGETGGPSAASKVAPEVEAKAIETKAAGKAKERAATVGQYRTQLDEYNRLMVDARRRAVEMFNQKYGTTTNSQLLKVDTAGNPNFDSTALRDRFNMDSMKNIDPRGAYEAEIKAAMMESVKARYQDGKIPAWVDRVGTEITGVSEPQPPKGYQRTLYERVLGGDLDAKSTFSALPIEEQERQRGTYEAQAPEEGQFGPQDVMAARQEYFQGLGAQPEMVMAERLLGEASKVWRAPVMRGGKRTLTFQNRPIDAVNVRIGGVSATLPKPANAEQAVGLMLSGRPFAIEQDGMVLPFKMDRSDPMVQAIYNEPNKSISSVKGAAQSNRGAVAARDLVDQSFGYLPQNVRNTIIQALLAHAGYNLTG